MADRWPPPSIEPNLPVGIPGAKTDPSLCHPVMLWVTRNKYSWKGPPSNDRTNVPTEIWAFRPTPAMG